MKNVQSGRTLILVKDAYGVSLYRHQFPNPIVAILSSDKLLYLTWSQMYSDVFVLDQKTLENPSTISWALKDNIDPELIYRDSTINIPWAKVLPAELLNLGLEFESELKLANPDMKKLKSLSPNPDQSFIAMMLELVRPNTQKHFALDSIYKDEAGTMGSVNVTNNIWTNLRDFT